MLRKLVLELLELAFERVDSDMLGYGAIAVALNPNGYGSILGITLGKRSAPEARRAAIKACLKAGGTHPEVKWTWKG